MLTTAIILLSVTVLILILYLADVKFEFRYSRTNNIESKKNELDSLSNTEFSILKLVSEGKTNKEIADQLGCALRTVERRLGRIRVIWREEVAGTH